MLGHSVVVNGHSLSSKPFYFTITSWSAHEKTYRSLSPHAAPKPKPDNTHNVLMNLLQTCYYQALNHSSVCSPSFPPSSCLLAFLFPLLPPSQWKIFCLSATKSNCSLIQTKPKSPVSCTKGGPGLSHQPPWRKSQCAQLYPHSAAGEQVRWFKKRQLAKTVQEICLSSEWSKGVRLTFCVSPLYLEFKSAWQLSYNIPVVTSRSSTTARTIDPSPFTLAFMRLVLTRKGCDFKKSCSSKLIWDNNLNFSSL